MRQRAMTSPALAFHAFAYYAASRSGSEVLETILRTIWHADQVFDHFRSHASLLRSIFMPIAALAVPSFVQLRQLVGHNSR